MPTTSLSYSLDSGIFNDIEVIIYFIYCFCTFKTYHFLTIDGDKSYPQDIAYDNEANTVLITVGDVAKYKDVKPSVNLLDFNTVSMKNVIICLLKYK